jgi:hypothetical protein
MQLWPGARNHWQTVTGFFLLLFAASLPHSIAAAQIALGAALLAWLIGLATERRWPARTPLDIPILLFFLLTALSAIFSLAPAISLVRLKAATLMVIVILVADALRTRQQVLRILVVLLASASVAALSAWWHKAAGDGVAIVSLSPDSVLRQAGVLPGDIILACNNQTVRRPEQFAHLFSGASSEPVLQCRALRGGEHFYEFTLPVGARAVTGSPGYTAKVGRYARARGTYSHYVTYAEVLLQLTALTIGLWLAYPRKWRWPGGLLAVVPILLAGALMATLTRGCWAGLVAGVLAMLWVRWGWRGRGLALLAAVLVLSGANLMLKQWRGIGFYNPADWGDQYRQLMWADGLRLMGEHPWLGIGMDAVKVHWGELGIRAYEQLPLHSHFHSTTIQLGVERGLLALAAWLWLMGVYLAVLLRLLQRYRHHKDRVVYGLLLGIFGSVCGFLLSGLVHYNLGDSEVAMVLWCLAGMTLALKRIGEESGVTSPVPAT